MRPLWQRGFLALMPRIELTLLIAASPGLLSSCKTQGFDYQGRPRLRSILRICCRYPPSQLAQHRIAEAQPLVRGRLLP